MDFLSTKNKKHHNKKLENIVLFFKTILLLTFYLMFFYVADADLTSTSFQLENPINIIEGGEASSTSFQYFSNTGQTSSGEGTSSSFIQNTGFLYFPTATSPVISATPGSTQVVLVWTPSVGVLANITSYELGISTTPGGPYTYTSVGNVVTSTKTSLTNGTPYYFKIRSYAVGLLLSESAEVTATPVAGTSGGGAGGGGGGGGGGAGGGGGGISGGVTQVGTGVVFSGRAYPLSKITILKDGQSVLSTIAGPDSNFTGTLSGLSSGEYTFSVYGTDKNGVRSSPFTFQISITSGATTQISGIFIAPTISVDKSEVKKGDNITIFGQSSPSSQVVISVNSPHEFFENTNSDADGIYLHNFDTSVLEFGQHSTKSKALKNSEISSFGDTVAFTVGTENILVDVTKKASKADFNNDGKANLIDFSIAAFWYKKSNPPPKVDLNGDGIVNLIDFSIMAFYWTG